jgi:UDP-N-acetylmuramate--alanine ligase
MFHFIGIGGIGMSGLAKILLQKGIKVSGSDTQQNKETETLTHLGAEIYFGHREEHLKEGATVVFSSGIHEKNPEYQKAIKERRDVLHRSDLLWNLMQEKISLAVAGTHGKTTTSSLLADVLFTAKKDPSFAIGGQLNRFNTNAHQGKGAYFVAEADESDATFLKYHPIGAIITSISNDHMTTFKTEENLDLSFKTFMSQVKEATHLFWCRDDERVTKQAPKGVSYGFHEESLIQIRNFKQIGWKIIFDLKTPSSTYEKIELALTGKHNALNGASVFALSLSLGIEENTIREAFKNFQGVKRRLEKKYDRNELLMLDDYAHHPKEIRATLKAMREASLKKRLIVLFQPHRLSRTRECLSDYSNLLEEADVAFFTDVYQVQEPHEPLITPETLKKALGKASYIPRQEVGSFFGDFLRPHDVFVTFGAGDTPKIASEITSFFENDRPKKLNIALIFGGKSVEHEVSLRSAEFVKKSLDETLYQVTPLFIPKEGTLSDDFLKELKNSDFAFPVLHGKFGEDGTIQGLFEMLDKPYAGCDFLGSAICMDKALVKHLIQRHEMKTARFIDFSQEVWRKERGAILKEIEAKLPYPLFVKGVHLGSSISVQKVSSPKDLGEAIDEAFKLDNHVLVEEGLENIREIEFAIIDGKAFPPGEVYTKGEIYDYSAKYENEKAQIIDEALLSESLLKKGIDFAEKAFLIARCKGFARVDTFLDQNGEFWFNEINPIPGFTEISLFPKICLKQGMTKESLMNQLIILGLHEFYQRKRCFG